MKKVLVLALSLILAFSVTTVTAFAESSIFDEEIAEGKDYFVVEAANEVLQKFEFEDASLPTLASQWGTRALETEHPINGNGSLAISSTDAGYPQGNVGIMGGVKALGTYYVAFDILPVAGVSGIAVPVFGGYSGDATKCIAEIGLAFTWEETTLTNVAVGFVGGWKESGYQNESISKNENGSYHVYFEYVINADNVALLTDGNDPHIWFNAKATDASNNKILLDSIEYGKVNNDKKYYSYAWDEDYESYDVGSTAYGSQPVWGNDAKIVDDWFDTKCLSLSGATATYTWGDVVGGLESRASESFKFLKATGKNYIQMDIGQDNCAMINIWTQGYYTSVQFNGTNWFAEGNVTGFSAEAIEGGHRISYCIDLPSDQYALEFKINVSGDNGVVYIDNLKVINENNAPFVAEGAKYNLVNKQDVAINVDLKEKELTSLAVKDGEAVSTEKYSIAEGVLTLDKSLFGSEASYSFVLTTAGGSKEFSVAQNDDRIKVTAVCEGTITKAYDGTNSVPQTALTLTGVEQGDTVSVSYTGAEYDAADVSATKVVFSGIVLSGADAGKYVLTSASLEKTATITKKAISVASQNLTKTKTYDGTTAAAISDVTLEGVVDGDTVTASAVASYNSADVTANKITVVYTLAGEDAGNYQAIANAEITEGVSIAKKAVTVTADSKEKKKGEADPELTYTVTGLVGSDRLTGALTRQAGEDVGTYKIEKGTLAGANYEITFTSANLTINKKSGCGSVIGGIAGLIAVATMIGVGIVVSKKKD